ncbi:DUF1684 domain-containing protein [Leucobacter sp. cx-328]|uniref:DUF1684 domain-containing protein n=1 Tax=unclassified Leucobacter TaxID=2621730 RepID=UPI00165EA9A7|nr:MULTISPECIES: DUF1684 domain-containing protein [unclassified Leucobacter]MBC9944717.1 DUF1684 domain-containing protein [Leucobacter sp. cx-328]
MSAQDQHAFATEHAAWHDKVEAGRASAHGPLSMNALHWLTAEPTALAGLPGIWSAPTADTVVIEFTAADNVAHNGEPVIGEIQFGPFEEQGAELLTWGDVNILVAERSGRISVRPQDPASAIRAAYEGTATFAADPAWRVTARFEPLPRERVEVNCAVPGAKQYFNSPGQAVFEVDGERQALTLFGTPGDLRIHFTDATRGDETFEFVRFLAVEEQADGSLVLDFNRATNPPFAYNPNTTCPFTPPENDLSISVRAGERLPSVA